MGRNLMQPIETNNIRLAASVLLVREAGESSPEIFMVQRPGRVDFPDLHVFPGGKVDEADFLPDLCQGMDDVTASKRLGVSAGGLRSWVAVIRECFEEAGVLLADRDGIPIDFSDQSEIEHIASHRSMLIDGTMTFEEFCKAENLVLACDRTYYFSHWITPEAAPRRFDTRFFLAIMPEGQKAVAHEWETEGGCWITPERALANHQAGDWQMISPTLTTLKMVAEYNNVDTLVEAVKSEDHHPVLTDELNVQGMHTLR
jgi:8-oxo-dGTP pyrophosphatase MutT (NUDIX family)